MRTLEFWVLGYLLNAIWQAPLVLLAAWAVARLVRRVGAELEHRVWVGALLLEALLPACPIGPGELWRALLGGQAGGLGAGGVRVAVGAGAVGGMGELRLPDGVFAGALATFAGYLIYSSGRLAWGLWRTDRLRRQARAVFLTGEAAAIWRRCYGMLAAGRGLREPEIFVSPMIHGPVTVGIWRPALLVQVGFLERVCDGDLEAVLAHEFAHVRRWDFAKNAMYGVLSLPVAWHPAVRLTRARMAESREMVCDAMAADAGAGRERFARSLLRVAALLAEGSSAGTVHVIGVGIFDANRFERRVMHLTQGRIEIRRSQRLILAVASGVVALATCAAALALRMDVAQPASGTTAVAAGRGAVIKVDGEVMAGLILYKKQPVYPAEAKANDDTVDGPVVLHVLVGKDGAVQEIRVAQSLRADYDQSALDAVREWRWQPYLLNDEPVAVDTNVTVTYSKAN